MLPMFVASRTPSCSTGMVSSWRSARRRRYCGARSWRRPTLHRVLRLASSSSRRIQLLDLLRVPFESTVPNIDEARFASPARAKADAVARPGAVTLAADTEIDDDGDRVGKPA